MHSEIMKCTRNVVRVDHEIYTERFDFMRIYLFSLNRRTPTNIGLQLRMAAERGKLQEVKRLLEMEAPVTHDSVSCRVCYNFFANASCIHTSHSCVNTKVYNGFVLISIFLNPFF